ncbi:MAG: Asp-tRNA(Asn)/Glu-tRNA(Gln) amidotransferase subunit GatC [Dehalococcoidia bacterium]
MPLGYEQVRHIARLARLGLGEQEAEKFRLQLSDILENFEVLKQVDTADVPPATHTIPLQSVLRKDDVAEPYPPSEILSNAPKQAENCFQVQAILE